MLCTLTFESECYRNHASRLRACAYARNVSPFNAQVRWWTRRWHRPPNDPLLLSLTPEELLVQIFQDRIDEDVAEALPPDSKVEIWSNDPTARIWDRQIAETGTFDPFIGLDPGEVAKAKEFLSKRRISVDAEVKDESVEPGMDLPEDLEADYRDTKLSEGA